jgi:hypothetical protein
MFSSTLITGKYSMACNAGFYLNMSSYNYSKSFDALDSVCLPAALNTGALCLARTSLHARADWNACSVFKPNCADDGH